MIRLDWQIEHRHGGDDFQIISDPQMKTHTIFVPTDDVREIEYLHEIAHAHLAESVHHLLSTAIFKNKTSDQAIAELIWPYRAATDWFADGLLMKWDPEAALAEIRDHVPYIFALTQLQFGLPISPDIGLLKYSGGLILAEAIFWNACEITVPRFFMDVVDVLLSIDPNTPSVNSLQKCTNRLSGLTSQYRVRLFTDNEVEVWEIYEANH